MQFTWPLLHPVYPIGARRLGTVDGSLTHQSEQVDCDQNKDLAGKYQVQGFPTIKFFGADKQTPIAYQGQRTAEALAQQSVRILGDQIQERLGVKQRSSSSRNSGGKEHAIMLNAADFLAKVMICSVQANTTNQPFNGQDCGGVCLASRGLPCLTRKHALGHRFRGRLARGVHGTLVRSLPAP